MHLSHRHDNDHHSTNAIGQLSVEILSQILRLAQFTARISWPYPVPSLRRTDLILVCRHFKRVVEADPHMWRLVTHGPSGVKDFQTIEKCLILSKTVPIDIALDNVQVLAGHPSSLASTLFAHRHRWRRTRLPASLWSRMPQEEWRLPQAEEIAFRLGENPPAALERIVAFPDAPRVRSLQIEDEKMLPGSILRLAGVRRLSLKNIDNHSITVGSIIDVLENSPQLELLFLAGFVGTGQDFLPAATDPNPLPCPSLVFLGRVNATAFNATLLPKIHAPNLARLRLFVDASSTSASALLSCATSVDPEGVFTALGRAAVSAECTISNGRLVIEGFAATLTQHDPSTPAEAPARILRLIIGGGYETFSNATLATIFQRVKCRISIKFRG